MNQEADLVFLLDCDNTLLDNDRIQQDISARLTADFGAARCTRYWQLIEQLRLELGYVDYLGALQLFRAESLDDPRVLLLSRFLLDYPFAERVYPGALDALRHLEQWGRTVILSDGDAVFQPHKIERAGLWDAVDGRVLIYVHKELMLDDVARHFPARHYVMIDDKLRVLSAMAAVWKGRLSTVFPRQGHYAFDAQTVAAYSPADLTVEHIGELAGLDLPARLGLARQATAR